MNEIKKRNKEELEQLLKEERDALREFRFQINHGKVKNNKIAQNKKKNIARILTFFQSIK